MKALRSEPADAVLLGSGKYGTVWAVDADTVIKIMAVDPQVCIPLLGGACTIT